MSSRRRRGGHGGGGGGGGGHGGGDARWLVTYADLLTLLMVLFLVLWVISTIDLKKFEKFKEGLGDFGNKAAAAAAADTTVPGELPASGPSSSLESTTTTTDPKGGTVEGTKGAGGGTGPVLDSTQLGDLAAGLQNSIDKAGFGSVAVVEAQQRGLVISVATDDVLFRSGSADLEPAARTLIGAVAPALSGIGNSVIVEGYTDRRPLHRNGYDNWDLSVDRAVSVVKVLRQDFGLDASRLAATGYGDQHPIAAGDDAESYAKNRRVQVVVVPSGPGPDGIAATTTSVAAATSTSAGP